MLQNKVTRNFVGLVIIFLLSACASYTGPQLTSVMASTCANQSQFSGFRTCVNNFWYSRVVAEGYGNEPNALLFNNRMRLLGQAVAQRQISDAEAIINATNLAYQLRANEQAEIRRQNNALLQVLSGTVTAPQTNTTLRVSCTRIGDASRQIYTFSAIACPFGYAPSL
jgi:hypothetical protein